MAFFPSLKQNFIAYHSSKVSDSFFEIHQLWQSGFSRVYSSSCCSCSFDAEIIKIGQYSNNIMDFQESTTILNARSKKVWKLIICTSYVREGQSYSTATLAEHASFEKDSLFQTTTDIQWRFKIIIQIFFVKTSRIKKLIWISLNIIIRFVYLIVYQPLMDNLIHKFELFINVWL